MAPTKKTEIATHTRRHHPRLEPLTLRFHGQRSTCYPTMFCRQTVIGMYLCVRIDAWIFWQETKTKPVAGRRREHGRAAPGRVERDEQGEARRANSTPNGGPHLELG